MNACCPLLPLQAVPGILLKSAPPTASQGLDGTKVLPYVSSGSLKEGVCWPWSYMD